VGRFLSLHRSTVHMPYFLTGYLMRKHSCFFPYAESARAKAMTYVALAVNITAAVLAAYSWGLKVEAGLVEVACHVIDTHCEPSFLGLL